MKYYINALKQCQEQKEREKNNIYKNNIQKMSLITFSIANTLFAG